MNVTGGEQGEKSKNSVSQRRGAFLYFKEYCDYTGIHGLRYIAEERTLVERIFWIIALVLSIFFCGLMIHEIIQKFVNYPVIVSFSMRETRLHEIPFPAVTICPRAKISRDYFNLTEFILKVDANKSVTYEEMKTRNLASTICEFNANNQSNVGTTEVDFLNFLNKSRTDFLTLCYFATIEIPCKEIFTPIITEEGICYSFNILDKNDIYRNDVTIYDYFNNFHQAPQTDHWNLEDGYGPSADIDAFPKRVVRPGVKNSLYVFLKAKTSDIEYECVNAEGGFLVSIGAPPKIPEVTEGFFTVPLKQRVMGNIIPHIITTSDGVKGFDSYKRDCYFRSERPLKYFKIYTQGNCLLECKTNFTLKYCGCVGFYMPRVAGTPVCILEATECMDSAERNFSMGSVRSDKNYDYVNCNCMPTCTDINYDLELSQSDWIWRSHFKENRIEEGKNSSAWRDVAIEAKNYQYSMLNLYFKKDQVETKERNELYGFSDFISNFGGLLGLFTGFSVLSFIEIIYFVSLRMWANIRLFGNWHGHQIRNDIF